MDFLEAERRFNELKRQHEAGSISAAEFDDRRERLKVKDRGGRWWVQGREGAWYYYDGSDWVLWVNGPNSQETHTTTSQEVTGTTTDETRYLVGDIPNSIGGASALLSGFNTLLLFSFLLRGERFAGETIWGVGVIAFFVIALVAVGLGVAVILGRRRDRADRVHALLGIIVSCLSVAALFLLL